jgi:hypothetical protein
LTNEFNAYDKKGAAYANSRDIKGKGEEVIMQTGTESHLKKSLSID